MPSRAFTSRTAFGRCCPRAVRSPVRGLYLMVNSTSLKSGYRPVGIARLQGSRVDLAAAADAAGGGRRARRWG
ncbi:hypothetical protein, partial [Micromonospora sp. 15K316]|uniref:hypothetical protein n=1 Tax=Micromonospora sp. 15K316 TaxID=2530376 RepID=UPI001A9F54A4